jgi:hypothetical protein
MIHRLGIQQNVRRLRAKDADFENQRFDHYVAQRGLNLDPRAKEAWELYHNDRDGTNSQYTEEQIDMLEQVGAPFVSMNYIYPIVSQSKALITNERPTGRVVPSWGPVDKKAAYIYDALLSALWRASHGNALFRMAAKDAFIAFNGVLGVFPKTFYKGGKFDLRFDWVSWQDFYIDPQARKTGLCYEDAEAMYIGRLIPERQCKNIYGHVPDERGENRKSNVLRHADEEEDNRFVLVRTVFDKMSGIYALFDVPDPVNRQFFTTRRVFKDAGELDRFQRQYGAYLKDYKEDVFVRIRTILGEDTLFDEVLTPLTVYPFAIYTPDDYQNPFGKSPVEYLREPQKGANKFTQTTILNAQLGSSVRWMGPRGSFIDKDSWTKYAATAGATYEYAADPTLPNAGKPEVIQPMPLASAWYQLGSMMKGYMEYNAGLPPFLQGDGGDAPDTATGSSMAGSFGSHRPRDLRARFETATAYLYKATMQYFSFYGNREMMTRYLDDREDIQELPLGVVLDDRQIIDHDVLPAAKTSLPSDRIEAKEALKLAISQTADPNWQKLLFEELMEHMDMPVGDRLRKKIDTLGGLQQQNMELADQIKDMDALIKRLSNEVIMGKKQAAIAKIDGEAKALSADTKARAEVALAKVQQGEVDDAKDATIIEEL